MPEKFTMADVIRTIRQKLNLESDQHLGIFLLAEGKYMMKQSSTLKDVYEKYRSEDGFLYLVYAEENVYG